MDTKVPYKAHVWQKWELTVNPAEGTYRFSVDGVKSSAIQLGSNSDGSGNKIAQMEFEPGVYGEKRDRMATLTLDDFSVVGYCSQRALIKTEVRRELEDELGKVMHPYHETGESLNIGHGMQLFFDPSSCADRWDVRAVANTPIKSPHNPVVEPDQLWEQSIGLPNVLYDKENQKFHMWYANYDGGAWAAQEEKRRPVARLT